MLCVWGIAVMNWEALGAVGEILGSIAVLFTLVYLSFQVKHARSEFRNSIAQQRFDTHRSLTMEAVHNDDLAGIMNALEEAWSPEMDRLEELEEAANLTSVEKRKFREYQKAWHIYRVQTIAEIEQLSEDQRRAFDTTTGHLYSKGVTALWYKWTSKNLPFRDGKTYEYIDELVLRSEDT